MLRLVARSHVTLTSPPGTEGYTSADHGFGWVQWQAATSRDPAFALTAVTDDVGDRVLSVVEGRKFLGIPSDGVATFNKWRLRAHYTPADAVITQVRVLLVAPGVEEELEFSRTWVDGMIEIQNVGFSTASRPLWSLKPDQVQIVVEATGQTSDGVVATSRQALGRAPERRAPWVLTSLYDAGRIPGALRYSVREAGGDGWGTRGTFSFLATNTDLVFNDISLEHGGTFPDHNTHGSGRGIDARYLGAGGSSNPLNGVSGDEAGNSRRSVLLAAQDGSLVAQQQIAGWIRQNRIRIDLLLDDPGVDRVYVGILGWNWDSLVNGKYPNGLDVLDPDTSYSPLGLWAPRGVVTGIAKHLSHLHVHRK